MTAAPRTRRDRAALDVLWDYLAVSAPPRPASVIFVFGSQDLDVPAHAGRLYHEGHAERVLVTGSYGLMTRGVFPQPEALVFRDRLVEAGVPAGAIVTEPAATNTLENVRLGVQALRQAGVAPESALLVAKEFVMRRCVATFRRHHPEVVATPCPPERGRRGAVDRDPEAFARRLVAEVDRLERYGARRDIDTEAIPSRVRDAVRSLRDGAPDG